MQPDHCCFFRFFEYVQIAPEACQFLQFGKCCRIGRFTFFQSGFEFVGRKFQEPVVRVFVQKGQLSGGGFLCQFFKKVAEAVFAVTVAVEVGMDEPKVGFQLGQQAADGLP